MRGGRKEMVRIVYILLVENVNLAVATPRPGHDLVLVSLEHDDGRV